MGDRRGWYIIPGVQEKERAERTVEEQLTGLDTIVENCAGKTVLDFGCAEGLISRHLARNGAKSCVGLSHVRGEIEVGRSVMGDLPVRLEVCDLNFFADRRESVGITAQKFDIVLLLSILHKLKHPEVFLAQALEHASDWVAIRLPAPEIYDARSDNRRFNVNLAMKHEHGFIAVEYPEGPRKEWQSIWRRKS